MTRTTANGQAPRSQTEYNTHCLLLAAGVLPVLHWRWPANTEHRPCLANADHEIIRRANQESRRKPLRARLYASVAM